MGKDANGEKIYKKRYYLLWTLREIQGVINDENDVKVSYHSVRQLVVDTKNILTSEKMNEDDCRCEKCENVELMLKSFKNVLLKNKMNILASKVKMDTESFINTIVCSIKNYQCCIDECSNCKENEELNEIISTIQSFDEVVYTQWVRQKNLKKEYAGTVLKQWTYSLTLVGGSLKYVCITFVDNLVSLKYLKNNLKPNEVILSVDFSRNYENKQLHEIQSAYFGHEAFTIFTCACYHVPCKEDNNKIRLETIPIAIISNETVHERNIAFHCNQKLLQIVSNNVPYEIDTVRNNYR